MKGGVSIGSTASFKYLSKSFGKDDLYSSDTSINLLQVSFADPIKVSAGLPFKVGS
jgi:hypothetical protein